MSSKTKKEIAIIVAVLLVVGAVFYFSGKDEPVNERNTETPTRIETKAPPSEADRWCAENPDKCKG